MKPLIDEATFKEFARARENYAGGQQAAHVFVPVGPDSAGDSPRILFVGQATRGMVYDGVLAFREATAECESLRQELLVAGGRSAFWHFVQSVCRQLIRTVGLDPGLLLELHKIAGWSNLAKIGSEEGNPGSELVAVQQEACAKSLQAEIREIRPVATVFTTGNLYEREILFPAVGKDGWRNNVEACDRVAVKRDNTYGTMIWTDHPRYMRASGFAPEVIAFVSGFISALVTARPSPSNNA